MAAAESGRVPEGGASGAEEPVVVVGAGLTGCMMAQLLSLRGVPVVVLENREDWRSPASARGEGVTAAFGQLTDARTRSINLALSHRGMQALKRAGLLDRVTPSLIPMRGRSVHLADGSLSFQPYGTGDQAIYSVSRNELNTLLLEAVEKAPGVRVLFGCKVQSVREDGTVLYTNKERKGAATEPVSLRARLVIGADGAFSRVRDSLCRLSRTSIHLDYIEHGYKELSIPPTKDGDFALPNPTCLSIWPRERFMLIALPNQDRSFTCTLFAPFEGKDALDSHRTDEEILEFFRQNFPTALPHMPDAVREYRQNPSSALLTLRLSRWVHAGRICVMGDAAHAIVPFLGQGMNAGFESALIFDELWERFKGDVPSVLTEFQRVRPPSTNVLAELSLRNYDEMRDHVARPTFMLKSRVDALLHRLTGDAWVPLYSMVQFTRVPYHVALRKAERQDKILRWSSLALLAGGVAAAARYALPAARSALAGFWGGAAADGSGSSSGGQ